MKVMLDDQKTELICENEPFSEGGEGLLYRAENGRQVVKLYKNSDPSVLRGFKVRPPRRKPHLGGREIVLLGGVPFRRIYV